MADARPFQIAVGAAAAGFLAEGAVSLIHPVGDDNWGLAADTLNIAFLLAVLGAATALPYVGRWLRVNRAGRVATRVGQIGFAAMGIETVASVAHGGNTLGGLFFVGLLLVALGTLTLAVTGIMARSSRWAAPLPFLGWLIAIAAGDHGGSIVFAAIWLVLGYAVTQPQVAALEGSEGSSSVARAQA
jgi:hypothetical protein